ncbi:MAG: VWA domain-containing protein, partial [Pseudomonadales bacterium]|nr:VWA domain-containing protein [Pseudomonadales bacterium]NRA17718.1 VWA domain-containing protein [Oceanospirillaceae bacterium]
MMLAELHFLRPQLLWLIMLIPLLCLLLWRLKSANKGWQKLVDREMLAHLLINAQAKVTSLPLLLLGFIWLITCLALAGPSWKKLPQPQFVNQQPLVLLVDLSPSMSAVDIKPSRLIKMRFKLIDLLRSRQQGLTAMVVYAGDAHVLAPLSDDRETLIALVPTLSPDIMPVSGSRTEEGLQLALTLIADQGYRSGDILLITDGVTEQAQQNMGRILHHTGIRLSVLGVGTEQGAPIPIAKQGFAKDAMGNIVMAKLDKSKLQQLAQNSGGIYRDMLLTNSDVEQLLAFSANRDDYRQLQQSDGSMDQWDDFGQWLVLLILALFLCSFRRGWLLQLTTVSLILFPLLQPAPVMALSWDDLWQTANQQGARALAEEDYQRAAASFSDESWQGIAAYKNQNYQQAGNRFSRQNSADGFYNQGNALAQQGEYKHALQAYDKALAMQPTMADALANKSLVKQLLKQKQQQQNQDQQNQDQQNQDQQNQDQQNQD